jgi:hypothetical protein
VIVLTGPPAPSRSEKLPPSETATAADCTTSTGALEVSCGAVGGAGAAAPATKDRISPSKVACDASPSSVTATSR